MNQYEVIVNKLNRRRSPVLDFKDKTNIVDFLVKGNGFSSSREITNQLGTWCQDESGFYLWQKGLNKQGAVVSVLPAGFKDINYLSFFPATPFTWLSSAGRGATISLIDTGIVASNDYYANYQQDIISGSNTVLDHGNFIGGILCGKKAINGLANLSHLYSIKYKSDGDGIETQLNNLVVALIKLAAFEKPLIINISQGFNLDTVHASFAMQEKQITGLIEKINAQPNKVIICAGDDNKSINDVSFPANLPTCISVGTVNERLKDLAITAKLNVLTPMFSVTSFDNSFAPVAQGGSSFCTAIISAMAACYLSVKQSISIQSFLDELALCTTERSAFSFDSLTTFQYHIIK